MPTPTTQFFVHCAGDCTKKVLHAKVLAYSLITRFMTTIDFFHVDYFCGSSCSYHVLCEEFKNNMG